MRTSLMLCTLTSEWVQDILLHLEALVALSHPIPGHRFSFHGHNNKHCSLSSLYFLPMLMNSKPHGRTFLSTMRQLDSEVHKEWLCYPGSRFPNLDMLTAEGIFNIFCILELFPWMGVESRIPNPLFLEKTIVSIRPYYATTSAAAAAAFYFLACCAICSLLVGRCSCGSCYFHTFFYAPVVCIYNTLVIPNNKNWRFSY